MSKPTLRSYRQAIASNPQAYEEDLPRLTRNLIPHLRRCGFSGAGKSSARPFVERMVNLLFDAQRRRPLFHIEAPLPYCWNAPKDWGHSYVRYEWGHLKSRNQNAVADMIENLSICSARCNQHVQTSMDIDEVRLWLQGSPVASRIDEVLSARERLFSSSTWAEVCRFLG